MRAAIRASLAQTGEDLGRVLSRALAGEVMRRIGRGAHGVAAGDDADAGRAGDRPARADGGGVPRDRSQSSAPWHGQERGTGRGQNAE